MIDASSKRLKACGGRFRTHIIIGCIALSLWIYNRDVFTVSSPVIVSDHANSLLMHISWFYYDNNERPPHCDSGILKGSDTWNEAMLESLVLQLTYSEQYHEMHSIEVVVDTNDERVPIMYRKQFAVVVTPG